MAEEVIEKNTVLEPTKRPPVTFIEVVCKSSGSITRFATGTVAKSAVESINQKLSLGVPLSFGIEAVKEGEEPVYFGPTSVLVDYGNGWKLQTCRMEDVIKCNEKGKEAKPTAKQLSPVTMSLMAEVKNEKNLLEDPQCCPFLEVVCKSSGSVRRFATGTEAGAAMDMISWKLGLEAPLVSHIEAVKEGEEPIRFGHNLVLVDYGNGWKLQAVMVDESNAKGKGTYPTLKRFFLVRFTEVFCKSSGSISQFATGTMARFALSSINQKLGSGVPLGLYIEAVKDGEEPISFGPNAVLMDYGNGWKLQTVRMEDIKCNGKGKETNATSKQFSPVTMSLKAKEEIGKKNLLEDPQCPLFLEVVCKRSGSVRRFATGTEAGFAMSVIFQKLGMGGPLVSHIEAVKEGEKPIRFGPNLVLVDYANGWKLQAVIVEESNAKREGAYSTLKPLTFLEVVCESSGSIRRFAPGTQARHALSLINQELVFGEPLALHIKAFKKGEEPISFGPTSYLEDYGNGWKLRTVIEEESEYDSDGEEAKPKSKQSSPVKVCIRHLSWFFSCGKKAV